MTVSNIFPRKVACSRLPSHPRQLMSLSFGWKLGTYSIKRTICGIWISLGPYSPSQSAYVSTRSPSSLHEELCEASLGTSGSTHPTAGESSGDALLYSGLGERGSFPGHLLHGLFSPCNCYVPSTILPLSGFQTLHSPHLLNGSPYLLVPLPCPSSSFLLEMTWGALRPCTPPHNTHTLPITKVRQVGPDPTSLEGSAKDGDADTLAV